MKQRSEKRRREVREAARLGAKKSRQKRQKRQRKDSEGVKEASRVSKNKMDRLRWKDVKEGLRKVRSRGERVEKKNMSVRDMLVGVNRRREDRNVLREIVNGEERGDINVIHGVSSLRVVLPIASNTSIEEGNIE